MVAIQFAVMIHSEVHENYIVSVNEKLPGTCVYNTGWYLVHSGQRMTVTSAFVLPAKSLIKLYNGKGVT